MTDERTTRKMSAILSADVKGYSRLMRDDEDSTIGTLTIYRSAMSNLIEKFHGHVVNASGDNLLAEFNSVLDAVNCAVEIQREFFDRNAKLTEERKMEFRIGVNLGDVVEEEGRIYGDGVNIAARMGGLAEAGGICISGSVHDNVESKLGLEYEFLGEQKVKNIDKPIRAYRVLSILGAAASKAVQANEKEHLKHYYKNYISKCISKNQSKAGLQASKSANLRSRGALSKQKVIFLTNNQNMLVNEMVKNRVGKKPYKIEYYLNKRFYEIYH